MLMASGQSVVMPVGSGQSLMTSGQSMVMLMTSGQ